MILDIIYTYTIPRCNIRSERMRRGASCDIIFSYYFYSSPSRPGYPQLYTSYYSTGAAVLRFSSTRVTDTAAAAAAADDARVFVVTMISRLLARCSPYMLCRRRRRDRYNTRTIHVRGESRWRVLTRFRLSSPASKAPHIFRPHIWKYICIFIGIETHVPRTAPKVKRVLLCT